MASLIPDSVKDTFSELLGTYGQIEAIKLQKRMADAQISLASAALPSQTQDAQARAQSIAALPPQEMSLGVKVGLGIAAALALYLIVK